jgi:uncharacterized protein (TIGR02271 family)
MEQAIVGVFDSESDAIIARESLCSAGFNPTNVRKILPDSVDNTTVADEDEGGIGGFFSRLFGTDDHPHVEQYSAALSQGHPVLVVQANSDAEADRAKDIMERCGAIDIEERAQTWLGTETATGIGTVRSSAVRSMTDTGKQTIPVVEEQLQVGKRTVDRGGVRIYMRETERPVEESVELREERVIIERRPVERPATAADMNTKERVFEIRTTAEEAVVAKTAHVIEEVEVGKETTQHRETVRDTVRRTDVDVENIENTSETSRSKTRQKPEQRLTP